MFKMEAKCCQNHRHPERQSHQRLASSQH